MGSNKVLRWKKPLLITLAVLIISILFILLVVTIVLFFLKSGGSVEKNENRNTDFTYRMRQYNPTDETTFVGMTELANAIPEKGFISYEDSMGNLNLISEFERDEYVCTGSCFCYKSENSPQRRRTTLTLPRGLMYLVAAFSGALAVNVAGQYFKDECSNQFEEDECTKSGGTIQSKVENCELLNKMSEEEEEKVDLDPDEDRTEMLKNLKERTLNKHRFNCKAYCMNRDMKREISMFLTAGDSGPAAGMSAEDKKLLHDNIDSVHEQSLEIDCSEITLHMEVSVSVGRTEPRREQEESAEVEYMAMYLQPHCTKESIRKLTLHNKWGPNLVTEMHVCTGHDHGVNPGLRCVKAE